MFVEWLGCVRSTFFNWKERYGKANEHNGWIPRDHWLLQQEVDAIIAFWQANPGHGYRRLTYMMLDQDVVAVSPTTVWRVLHAEGAFANWSVAESKKGTGFHSPSAPHKHWHTDISYIKVKEVFYYLVTVLDGYSRAILAHDVMETMTSGDVQRVIEMAREAYPGHTPRIISDNGGQFIAKDFKEYIRLTNLTHVKTSVAYPQSNGKQERFFRTMRSECLRKTVLLDHEDARAVATQYIKLYNHERLHAALGYITPMDKLEGREDVIFKDRDRKLEEARKRRAIQRQRAKELELEYTNQ